MEQKQAIADRLKQANNILVTVSNNPSVDQLSACIGLTLALNKMGKHATAVFSGTVPSTMEFLQPEKTIEKNTDSLRDFIIALDKAKADKLRYKVEDKVVKIFITPYKTSISDKDLEFSQGDFNVDVVVALGVHEQNELDQAITAHGRILHDAVVTTVNTKAGGELGTINWLEAAASSLSELVAQLVDEIDKQIMDGQMATALLTGIVAETERFSNAKTTPTAMSISAELMGAGANQQLVATKLEAPAPPPPPPAPATPVHDQGAKLQGDQGAPESHADDGTLEIAHVHDTGENNGEGSDQSGNQPDKGDDQGSQDGDQPQNKPLMPPVEPDHDRIPDELPMSQIHIDEHGALQSMDGGLDQKAERGSIDPTQHMASSHMILQPPKDDQRGMGAAGMPEGDEAPSGDPLSMPGMGNDGFSSNPFGPPQASASIAPPDMPYLPPSMTPGGRVAPAVPAAPAAPPPEPNPAVTDTQSLVPEPPAPDTPQIIQPSAPVAPPAPSLPAPTLPAPEPPLPPAPVSSPIISPTPGTLDPSSVPAPAPQPPQPPVFTPPAPAPAPTTGETLSQIEADVHSPHAQPAPEPQAPTVPNPPNVAPPIAPPAPAPEPAVPAAPAPATPPPAAPAPSADLASARDAVLQAIGGADPAVGPEPIKALNAQPLGAPLHEGQPAAPAPSAPAAPAPSLDATANPTFTLPDIPQQATPPAGPPPMMPPGA